MLKKVAACVVTLVAAVSFMNAAPPAKGKRLSDTQPVFYIFTERGSNLNHFVPSGWMGDFGDLKMNQGWTKGVAKPKMSADKKKAKAMEPANAKDETCIQIRYTAERKQGNGWGGIYWQHPANNWGDKRGGFDLSGYSQMTFWAKGDVGGEVIDKFQLGGIPGQTEEGDSDEAQIGPVTLTKDWKLYSVDLTGLDLSHIIGGFVFAANADSNPQGFTIYIDEIRLEK